MDMDFAVSGPLVRRSRLVPGSCPSTRTFALRFLQTSPRGDSPCVVANPSPPSGWVEDFHLQATEHAQHTTKPLRGQRQMILRGVGQRGPPEKCFPNERREQINNNNNTLDAITKAGTAFRSLSDPWADNTTPHGRLMLIVLGGPAAI